MTVLSEERSLSMVRQRQTVGCHWWPRRNLLQVPSTCSCKSLCAALEHAAGCGKAGRAAGQAPSTASAGWYTGQGWGEGLIHGKWKTYVAWDLGSHLSSTGSSSQPWERQIFWVPHLLDKTAFYTTIMRMKLTNLTQICKPMLFF